MVVALHGDGARVAKVCVKTFVPVMALAPVMALFVKGRFFRFHMILCCARCWRRHFSRVRAGGGSTLARSETCGQVYTIVIRSNGKGYLARAFARGACRMTWCLTTARLCAAPFHDGARTWLLPTRPRGTRKWRRWASRTRCSSASTPSPLTLTLVSDMSISFERVGTRTTRDDRTRTAK